MTAVAELLTVMVPMPYLFLVVVPPVPTKIEKLSLFGLDAALSAFAAVAPVNEPIII